MKKPVPLKLYLYSIPACSAAVSAMTKKISKTVAEHEPLLKVTFDFEYGYLRLEGDWKYLVLVNKHSKDDWLNCHQARVYINATLYPAHPINLNDDASDGFIFILQGSIEDGGRPAPCSGLLSVERIWENYGPRWTISCSLYDLAFDHCEIKINLPIL
jgi:hypothetical protein